MLIRLRLVFILCLFGAYLVLIWCLFDAYLGLFGPYLGLFDVYLVFIWAYLGLFGAYLSLFCVYLTKYEQKCIFSKMGIFQNSRNAYFSEIKAPAGATKQRIAFENLPLMN